MHPDENRVYDYYFLFEYEVVFKNDNMMFKYDDIKKDIVISKVTKPYRADGDWDLQAEALKNALPLIKERCKEKGLYYINSINYIKEVTSDTIRA